MASQAEKLTVPPLADEERARTLALLERLRRERADELRRRGGRLFRSSGEILAELRAERARELP